MRFWEHYWKDCDPDFLRTEAQARHPSRKMIAKEVKGRMVLEVGSASCVDYPFHRADYIALDLMPHFIGLAYELYPGLKAVVGSALQLPFVEKSIPTVYCRAMLEHLHPDEWPIAVREMWRLARRRMIVVLYLNPAIRKKKRMPARKWKKAPINNPINGDELVELLHSLPGACKLQIKESPQVRNARINWLYILDKVIA